MSKVRPLDAFAQLRRLVDPIRTERRRIGSSLRVALGLFALFLVVGSATAEESVGGEPSHSDAELEQQAAEWETFKSKVEQELSLLDGNYPDAEAFGVGPMNSWEWWEPTTGNALRGRLVRWLRSVPFMKGASDPTLWFMVTLFGGIAQAEAKVEDLEAKVEELDAKSPDNAPFAIGFGPGSEKERFALWTGCQTLWPLTLVDPKDDSFEESVTAAVESRLRGARLYGDLTNSETSNQILRIVVNRGSGLYSISVGLQKTLFDPLSRLRSRVYGDYRGGAGYGSFGSGPPEYIRSVLADHLDRFIADYLRVNAGACGGSPEASK